MRNWCRHAAVFGLLSLLYWQTELPRISDTNYSLSAISLNLGGGTRDVNDTYELTLKLMSTNIKLGIFLVLESIFFDRSQLFSAITMVYGTESLREKMRTFVMLILITIVPL